MRSAWSLALFSLFGLSGRPARAWWIFDRGARINELCPQVRIDSPDRLKFGDTEKRLLCGDPENPPWSRIPKEEAVLQAKVFLQARGYQHAVVREDGERIVVSSGPLTLIKEVKLEGAPPELVFTEFRGSVGEPLTPKRLNEIELWLKRHLQWNGYPCAKVKSRADPDSGIVTATIAPGEKRLFGEIEREPTPLRPEALDRYEAFHPEQEFDERLLALTERRIIADGLVLGTYFVPECEVDPFRISQKLTEGDPRLVTAGIGFDTEELVKLQASWKAHRLGALASTATISGFASWHEQRFDVSGEWYWLPAWKRHFLKPSLEIRHENRAAYEDLAVQVKMAPAFRHDFYDSSLEVSGGPSWNYLRTYRGAALLGSDRLSYLSLEGDSEWRSHDYEYYISAPLRGYRLTGHGDFHHKAIASRFTAARAVVTGEYLWNFDNFDPPLLVVGVRGGFSSTIPGRELRDSQGLPVSLRNFLGGSQNLRGYGHDELPYGGSGAFTSAFAGFEVRYKDFSGAGFEPLVFWDVGGVGRIALHLDAPFFQAPGFGFRYKTFAGALRVTAAHGFAWGGGLMAPRRRGHWQYFVSLGEEF